MNHKVSNSNLNALNGNSQNGTPQSNGMKKQASAISLSKLTDKIIGHKEIPQPKAHDLSATYVEHTWDLETLAHKNKDSRVNREHPEKSAGLTQARAEELLQLNGPNKLPAPKEISDLELFLSQFCNLLWILMTVTATLSLVGFIVKPDDLTSLWVTLILYVMIFVMCFISFYQEREARKVVRGFENLLPQNCVVIREGNEMNMSAEKLVVGDIIKIKSGIRVPADARILHCSELKLETSSITGESEPVEYRPDAVNDDVSIFESRNVAFNGSMCVEGEGIGLVVKTASDTIIGQIATMTTNQSNKGSRLEYQIKIFVKFLTCVAVVVGVIAFVVGGIVSHWSDISFLLVTAFTVCALAMIPEGMPATVTSILTLVARRLAQKNVYLKRLDIVEALGSANIIASDKTGTLTKNEMVVTDVWYSNEYVTEIPEYKLSGGNQRTMTVKTISRVEHPLADLLIAMTICNTACFDDSNVAALEGSAKKASVAKVAIEMPPISNDNQKSLSKRTFSFSDSKSTSTVQNTTVRRRRQKRMELIQGMRAIGAPSEVAMIKYAEQLINVHDFRRRFNVIFEVPFNSKRKYHLVIARLHDTAPGKCQYQIIIKGAPEIVIQRCTQILTTDGATELSEERRNEFQTAYQTYGEHGRRVIGFAQKLFTDSVDKKFSAESFNFPFEELTYIGICAIMDPPRDETARAISECTEAGIKVFMVTGDHHITASAIAKQIGLCSQKNSKGEPDWEVVKGEEINRLSQSDWDRMIGRQNLIFARTTPEQKFRIVEECQKRNQIIAMTGDGVNDAPALKKSDIGVGMGSGSDVAKQAADIVLVDDNFSSIVGAVEEGRLMFDNIKKLMVYVLTHAFPELWALFIHYLFGMPLGTTALMILSIDLGTEILPGIALCKEPLEGDVMKRPPRKTGKILIGKALIGYVYGYTAHIQVLACFFAYMSVFWSYGFSLNDLVMSQEFWQKNASPITASVTNTTYDWHQQEIISAEAKSAWQIGIVFGQVFHIFSSRTLRQSIFTHGLFSNRIMIVAIIAEVLLLLLFVYCPGVNSFLGGSPTSWQPWLIVALFGLFILSYNEVRKFCIRHWPQHPIVRIFKF